MASDASGSGPYRSAEVPAAPRRRPEARDADWLHGAVYVVPWIVPLASTVRGDTPFGLSTCLGLVVLTGVFASRRP